MKQCSHGGRTSSIIRYYQVLSKKNFSSFFCTNVMKRILITGKIVFFFNIEKVVFFLVYFPENRKSLFKKLWKILRNANQVYTTVKKSILEGSRNVHPQKKEDFQGKEK